MNKIKKFSLLLVTALLSLSLVACGGSTPATGGDTGTATGDTTEPSTGSTSTTFTYAIGGEPSALDPAYGTDTVTGAITRQIFAGLFHTNEDGSVGNELCADYSYDEATLTYTITILPDLKWSDGEPMTAADFVYGIKRSVGMGSADSYYSYFITDWVKGAKAYGEAMADVADMTDIGVAQVDDTTFTITLEKQCPYFLSLMTAGVFYPLRPDFALEHDYSWATKPFPCSGAFTVTSIDSASEYKFEKNPNYYMADQVTKETLTAKIMPDMNAQLLAYQTGEIDMATSLNSDVTTVYAGQEDLVLAPSVINYYVMLNSGDASQVEALKDVNVRKALQDAINSEEIVSVLDAGDLYYPLYGFVPVGFEGNSGDFREEGGNLLGYNPDEAKELLAAAGYGEDNPLELTYYYNQNAIHDTVAQVIQQQWAAVGVNVTLKTGEIRTFFDDRDNALFDLARGAMSADYMDVSTYLDMAASWNQPVVSWGDATYDEMLTATQTESDPAKRLELLHAAEKYLVEDMAYTIPLFGYSSMYLIKPGTTGIIYGPQGGYDLSFVK